MILNVDTNKCTKCGVCANICPSHIIAMNESTGYPNILEKYSNSCIKCGHCTAYCPTDACFIDAYENNDFKVVSSSLAIDSNQAVQFLKTRRSTRRYTNDEMSSDDINALLNIASISPTAKNMQPIKWVVINGFSNVRKVGDKMSELLLIASEEADARREKAMYKKLHDTYEAGVDVLLRGAPALILATIPEEYHWSEDAYIATTYLELACHALGFGSCWAGFYMHMLDKFDELGQFSKIPNGYKCPAALMVGKPVYKKTRKIPKRNEPDIFWVDNI